MSIFSAIGNFLGFQDPSKAAEPYLRQIPGIQHEYYDPYVNAGRSALTSNQQQYGSLINNPGGTLNQIGQGYQQSPGYQFALQQALQAGNNASGAGGMAGSPQHQQQNMELATNLANQDYHKYLSDALGLYKMGSEGMHDIANTGYNASSTLAGNLGSNLMNQGNLAFSGAANQNQLLGSLLGMGLGSFMPGGFFGGGR